MEQSDDFIPLLLSEGHWGPLPGRLMETLRKQSKAYILFISPISPEGVGE